MKLKICATAVIMAGMAAAVGAGGPGSLSSGIDQPRPGIKAYTDLYHLCFYNEGARAGMMSSHDDNDRNIDLMHFHGRYRGRPVLARIEGPGVVYRIWSAGPTGELFFWLDGDDAPAFECGFERYLDGKCVSNPAFAVGRSANYTPLPFNRSLMITAKNFKPEGAYYQVSYMTFENGHDLPTATEDGTGASPDDLAAAVRFWESMGSEPGRDPGGEPARLSRDLSIAPGKASEVSISGAGLVTGLFMADAQDPLEPMSDVDMRIFWDGEEAAAVDSPVDAFFGNRFDARRTSKISRKSGSTSYRTMALSATPDGYSSRWPMPFARGMRVMLINRGNSARKVRLEINYRRLGSLPENAMRFHATYREQDYPDDELSRENLYGLWYRVDQDTNYVVLEREGRGYYVGVLLYVISPRPSWWGEGDEMIWIDGGDLAVIRGTGTEDEFNWSFGFKENRSGVSGALLAGRLSPTDPDKGKPYSVLYRYRPGDYVPFQKSIKVTYERLGSTTDFLKRYPGALVNVSHHRGEDYRSVAFFYLLP